MQVASAIVGLLRQSGIDTVFGVPGNQTLPLNKAIDRTEGIRYVMARNETAVTHQAWGYAETSEKLAATLVVPGPGDTNAMNGLKNAFDDDTPLLHISVDTDPELRGGGVLHEAPSDLYDRVVKENITIDHAESVLTELSRAIAIARSMPMGPVRVGLPKSCLQKDLPLAQGEYHPTDGPDCPETKFHEAIALLSQARRPVIIAGGEMRTTDIQEELISLAEYIDAPVVTTKKGKGLFPEDHPLSLGTLSYANGRAINSCLAASDVALAVGTNLGHAETQGWTFEIPEKLIRVTIHGDRIGVGYDPAVAIVSSPKKFVPAIVSRLENAHYQHETESGADRVALVRTEFTDLVSDLESAPIMNSVQALQTIRRALPREAIVALCDAGGSRMWGDAVFPAYGPDRFLSSGTWTTMGTGLPGAIGAQVANPDQPVVSIVGDGSLLMCLHELHTIVNEQIAVTVVVLNNSDYAIISDSAERSYGFEPGAFSWGDTPINFEAIATAFGIDMRHATTHDEIQECVIEGTESDHGTLIEIPIDPCEPIPTRYRLS